MWKLQFLRPGHLLQEPTRLKSSSKIHNFTTGNLPTDFITLLNKGTNFIPTCDAYNVNSVKKTITEEMHSALCQVIKNSNPSAPHVLRRHKTKRSYKPYEKKNPLKLLKDHALKPNFNLHVIDYVNNTVHFTKEYLNSKDLNPIFTTEQINITPSTQWNIFNFANPHRHQNLTKTWDGPSYQSPSFTMNTQQ